MVIAQTLRQTGGESRHSDIRFRTAGLKASILGNADVFRLGQGQAR